MLWKEAYDKNELLLFRGKVRRIKCAFCGRKVRDWKKVRKISLSVPFRGHITVRICEECYEKYRGD